MKKSKYKKDIFIILAFFGMAVLFFVFNKIMAESGDTVFVYVDETVYAEYDLSKDNQYEINTEYGKNVITIKDGHVSISSASCKNQVCVNHNPISTSNESIICIPNHLVVRIKSEKNGDIDDIAK